MAFDRRRILGRFAIFGAALGFLLTVYYLKGLVRDLDAHVTRSPDHHNPRPENTPLHVDTSSPSDDGVSKLYGQNHWRDLSEGEAKELIQWLHGPEQMLNLVFSDLANINDSYIWTVEAMINNKSDILRAIDLEAQGDDRPVLTRYARVVLFGGGNSENGMQEYKVGPIPISADTTIEPLTSIYNNRPGTVPFNSRYLDEVRVASYNPLLDGFKASVADVVLDIYGKDIADFDLKPIVPYSLNGSSALIWLQWSLKGKSSYLMCIDFWTQVDLSGRDPGRYYVRKIRHGKRIWTDTDAFKRAWKNGELQRDPDLKFEDPDWAVPNSPALEPQDLEDRMAPINIPLGGKRYTINSQTNHVRYLGWDFFLSWRRETGLSFWNLKFRGDSVLYEMSLQEASASYSMATDPAAMSSQLLDRFWGLGAASTPLIEGYDCPYGATFLNSNFYMGERSYRTVRNICIFEMDLGRPMSRHSDRGFARSTRGVALIVRWMATVGNYDYQFDSIFHPSGSIELEVRASGFLLARYYDENSNGEYGSRVRKSAQGVIHDHIMNFKLDFDILGVENSFQIQTLKTKTEYLDWVDDDEGLTTSYLATHYVENEDDARLDWPSNGDAMFLVVNKDVQNKWGMSRGYRISPGAGSIHRTVSRESPFNKRNSNHAKTHVAITQQKDTEPSSSAAMNQNLAYDPLVDFDKFFDSENLTQTDLVVWVNIGTHHFPRAEDAPFTLLTEARAGLLISPFNFKDDDLSGEFRNSVLFVGRNAESESVETVASIPHKHREYVQMYKGPELEFVDQFSKDRQIPEIVSSIDLTDDIS